MNDISFCKEFILDDYGGTACFLLFLECFVVFFFIGLMWFFVFAFICILHLSMFPF